MVSDRIARVHVKFVVTRCPSLKSTYQVQCPMSIEEVVDNFYDDLQIIMSHDNSQFKTIMEDLIAKISEVNGEACMEKFGQGETRNEKGDGLINITTVNDLNIININFQRKKHD